MLKHSLRWHLRMLTVLYLGHCFLQEGHGFNDVFFHPVALERMKCMYS